MYDDFLEDYNGSLTDVGKQEIHAILQEGGGADAVTEFFGGLDQAREFV